MFGLLKRLSSSTPSAPRSRPALSPGRLYAKMSAEFRAYNAKAGCGCVMPLPYASERAFPGDCNWRVQQLWSECTPCRRYLHRLIAKYSDHYDMRDLVGTETADFLVPIAVREDSLRP